MNIFPKNPNIRTVIIDELKSIITTELPALKISANIGEVSFELDDFPGVHMYFGDETIDTFNINMPYRDYRTSPLNIAVRIAELDDQFITSQSVPAAQREVEMLSEAINTFIEDYEYPYGLIEIVLTNRDVVAETSSDPRVMLATMIYQVKYRLNLDHPYYRLPYELPKVPKAKFIEG